ncbi:hypothetical protein CEXT_716711 [Caerostris extrusa]|uniref:Uncharacterized protein n=1 Tax=Caerostris extrusa TaxID=172846 RepID=A0AAV4RLN6_CAEEX|nr:hypothetical protein CEXT_716711 [Caerostris extrusa]
MEQMAKKLQLTTAGSPRRNVTKQKGGKNWSRQRENEPDIIEQESSPICRGALELVSPCYDRGLFQLNLRELRKFLQ